MEGFESNQMRDFSDIKQSPQWGIYLSTLGWTSFKTPRGIQMFVLKTFLGSFVKVQRPKNVTEEDLKEIDAICKENRAIFCKLETFDVVDESILKSSGYEISGHPIAVPATLYFDLDLSEEELWKNVSRSGKYSINRARREGSRVEFIKNPTKEAVESFYKLAKATSSHNHFYMSPFKEVYSRSTAFGDESYLAFVYDGEGNIVGGKQFLGYDGLIFFSLGGTSDLGRTQKSGYLLMWESMLYFKKLGYTVMDLEGKEDSRFPGYTKNWGKFTYFKEKFGPISKEFPYPYIKYYSLIFKLLVKAVGVGF